MEKLSPTLLPKQSTRKYIVALQDTYKILQAYCYLHTQTLQAPGYNRSTSLSPFFNLIVGFTIKLQLQTPSLLGWIWMFSNDSQRSNQLSTVNGSEDCDGNDHLSMNWICERERVERMGKCLAISNRYASLNSQMGIRVEICGKWWTYMMGIS